jgi:glycosyltransferase involved in cell wall biosynthesis
MRICLLGAKTYPPVIGGIETHVYEIARRLAKRNHEVHIFVGNESPINNFLHKNVIIHNVPFIHSRYLIKMSMVLPILKELRKYNFDIIHAHDVTMGFITGTFLKGTHSVYTIHGISYNSNDWPVPVNYALRFLQSEAILNNEKIIAIDDNSAKIARILRKDIITLGNGVDYQIFEKDYAKPLEYGNDIKILFVGRLVVVKAPDILINAFLSLPNEIKKLASLFIIGSGPLENILREKETKDSRVHILGEIDHNDIIPYFVYNNIFVLPSLSEGLPIALLEAMAAKNSCIITNISDFSNRFKNDEVLFVRPNDVKDLQSKLEELILNASHRNKIGDLAKERIVSDYNWDKIVDQLEKIYFELK